ncbi:MAG: hypothetical protein U0325_10500 [Polyangiales bacterium]
MRALCGLLVASSALVLACRNPPSPTPGAGPTPVAQAPASPTADVPAPRDAAPGAARGLVATLMGCSPATRTTTGGGWTLSLRLTVHNQAERPLPLRREGIRVTVDEDVRGDLSGADAFEGPTEIAPLARATLILRPRFPASENAPVTVTFAFDSQGGLNHPISFPIPSGGAPPRGDSPLQRGPRAQ